jgi:sec-independent protein translocase protein TatA
MMGLSGKELLLILIVAILLFGSSKIPNLARSLGKSINEFKKGREEGAKEGDSEDESTTPKKTA